MEVRLAELGCTVCQIIAITSHVTEKEVTRYICSASQKVMEKEGMKKLSRNLTFCPNPAPLGGLMQKIQLNQY